jgi:hypothetical protein
MNTAFLPRFSALRNSGSQHCETFMIIRFNQKSFAYNKSIATLYRIFHEDLIKLEQGVAK